MAFDDHWGRNALLILTKHIFVDYEDRSLARNDAREKGEV